MAEEPFLEEKDKPLLSFEPRQARKGAAVERTSTLRGLRNRAGLGVQWVSGFLTHLKEATFYFIIDFCNYSTFKFFQGKQ